MVGLLELVKKKAVVSKATAERKQLLCEYAELIRRADTPGDGDEKRLVELMEALGFSMAHVELHLTLLAEARKLKDYYDRIAPALDQVQALQGQMNGLDRQIATMKTKMIEAWNKKRELETRSEFDRQQAGKLVMLAREYPELLGEDFRKLDAKLVTIDAGSSVETATIYQARQRAGLQFNQVWPGRSTAGY